METKEISLILDPNLQISMNTINILIRDGWDLTGISNTEHNSVYGDILLAEYTFEKQV
jgi:hypothetical protein